MQDGLHSGDVYRPESRHYVSFTNLVYDPTHWTHKRDLACTELHLPQAPDDFAAHLQNEFNEVAQRAACGWPGNDLTTIPHDRLHLKQRDALELAPRLMRLRRTIKSALPVVYIEDRLMQVNAWCDFTRGFRLVAALSQ